MTYSPGYPVLPVQTQVVVAPHRCSTAHVVIAWVCAVLTLGYLLPWAIAATRNRSNVVAIALIDLFLGWSLVGWVAALVMACGSDRTVVLVHNTYAPQPYGPPGHPAQAYPQPYPPPGYAPQPYPQTYAPPPALPAAPAQPVAQEPEPTRVDPFGTEPTRPLGPSPWQRSEPYGSYDGSSEPPSSGTGSDHRR